MIKQFDTSAISIDSNGGGSAKKGGNGFLWAIGIGIALFLSWKFGLKPYLNKQKTQENENA